MCMYFKSNHILNFEGLVGKVVENGCEGNIKVKFHKPSIFDNPKWVTAITTDLEVGLVEGKDYKVYKVEEDKFWVYNNIQSSAPVWYYKDRFHKVNHEDLLPEKVTSEENEDNFEDLVIDHSVLNCHSYIVRSKFSDEQLDFMQEVLPTHSNKTFTQKPKPKNPLLVEIVEIKRSISAGKVFVACSHIDFKGKELSFNDIFKHESEI